MSTEAAVHVLRMVKAAIKKRNRLISNDMAGVLYVCRWQQYPETAYLWGITGIRQVSKIAAEVFLAGEEAANERRG